jgi:hypothetical protein
MKHRTNECPTLVARRCASCKTDDHASWSRDCPTFIKKLNELNDRNPENNLQYIPTADPWTWTANVQPVLPQPHISRPAVTRERSQPPKKTQAPTRRVDSYVPRYDSYVPSYDRSGKRTLSRTRDWSDPDPAPVPASASTPVIHEDLINFLPFTKDYLDSINNENPGSPVAPTPAPDHTTPTV